MTHHSQPVSQISLNLKLLVRRGGLRGAADALAHGLVYLAIHDQAIETE